MMGKRRKDQLQPAIILLLTIAGLNGNPQGQFNIPTSGTVNLLVSPNASQPAANNSSSNQTDSAGGMFIAPPSAETIRDLLQRFPLTGSSGTSAGNFALPTESLQSGSAQPPSSSNVNLIQSSPEIANNPMTNPSEQVNILRVPFGAASPIDPLSPPTVMHNTHKNTVSFGFSLPLTEMGAKDNKVNLAETQTSLNENTVAASIPVNNNDVIQPQSAPLFNVQAEIPANIKNVAEIQTSQSQPPVTAPIPSNNNDVFQHQPTPLFNVQNQNPANPQSSLDLTSSNFANFGQESLITPKSISTQEILTQSQLPNISEVPTIQTEGLLQDLGQTQPRTIPDLSANFGQGSQFQSSNIPITDFGQFSPLPLPSLTSSDLQTIQPGYGQGLLSPSESANLLEIIQPASQPTNFGQGVLTQPNLLTTPDLPQMQSGPTSNTLDRGLLAQSQTPNIPNSQPINIGIPTVDNGQGVLAQSKPLTILDLPPMQSGPITNNFDQSLLAQSQTPNIPNSLPINIGSPATDMGQGVLTQPNYPTIPDLPPMQSGPTSNTFDQGLLAQLQTPNNSLLTNIGNPATDIGQGVLTRSNQPTITDLPPMQSGLISNNFDRGLLAQSQTPNIPNSQPTNIESSATDIGQGVLTQPNSRTILNLPPMQSGPITNNFDQGLLAQSQTPNIPNSLPTNIESPATNIGQGVLTQPNPPTIPDLPPMQSGPTSNNFDQGPLAQPHTPNIPNSLSTNIGSPAKDIGQGVLTQSNPLTIQNLPPMQSGLTSNTLDQGLLAQSQTPNIPNSLPTNIGSPATDIRQGVLAQSNPLIISNLPPMQSDLISNNFDQGLLAQPQIPNIPNSQPTTIGSPAKDIGQGVLVQSNPLTIRDLPPMQSGPTSNTFDQGLLAQSQTPNIPNSLPTNIGSPATDIRQGVLAQSNPLTIPNLPPMQSGLISNNFDQGLLAQSQIPNIPNSQPTNIGSPAKDIGQGVLTQSNPLKMQDLPPMQSGPTSNTFDQGLLAQSQTPNIPNSLPTDIGSPATDQGLRAQSQTPNIPNSLPTKIGSQPTNFGQGVLPQSNPLTIPNLPPMQSGPTSKNFDQDLLAQSQTPNIPNSLPALYSTISSQSLQNPDSQQIRIGQPLSSQLPPVQQQISSMPTLPTSQPDSQPQQSVTSDQMISQQGIYSTRDNTNQVSGSQQTGFTNTLTSIPNSLSRTQSVSAQNSQVLNPIQDFNVQKPNSGQAQHQSTNVRQYSPPPPSTNITQPVGDQRSSTPKVPQQFPSSQGGPWSQSNPQVQPLPHLNQDVPALQPTSGDIGYQSNANTATGSPFRQLQQHPTKVRQIYATSPSANMPNFNSPTPQVLQQFPSPWTQQNPQLQSLPNQTPALLLSQQMHALPYPNQGRPFLQPNAGDLNQVSNANMASRSVFNKLQQQSTNVRQSSPTLPSANMARFLNQQFPSSQHSPWTQPNPQQSNTPDSTFNQPRHQSINFNQQSSTNMQSVIPQYLRVQGSPTSQIPFQSSIGSQQSPWSQSAHFSQNSDKSGRNYPTQRQLQFQTPNTPSQRMNYAQQPSNVFNHQALFHQKNSPPSSLLSSTPPTNIPAFYSQNSRKSINNKQWEKYGALEALLDASPVHVLREVELAGRVPLKNLPLHTSLAAQIPQFKNLPTPMVQIPTKTGHAIPEYSTQNVRMPNHMTQRDTMSPQMIVSLQTNESMQMPAHNGQLIDKQNQTAQPIHMQTQNSQNRQMLTQSPQANWMPTETTQVGRVPTQGGQFLQNQAAQPVPMLTQGFQNKQMPSRNFQSIQMPRQNAEGSGLLIQRFQSMQMPTDLVSKKPNQNTPQRPQQTMQPGQLPTQTVQTNQANQSPNQANKTERITNKPQEPMVRSLGIPDSKAILYSNTNELPRGAAQVQRPSGNNMMMNMLMMQQMESSGLPIAKIASMLSPRPTAPPPVRPKPTGGQQNLNLGYYDPVMQEFIPNQAMYGPEIALPKRTTKPNTMSLSNQYQNSKAGNFRQTKSNGVFQNAIALIEQARLNAWYHIKRLPKSTILNQFYEWKRNLGRGNLPPVIPEFLQYLKETLTKMAPMYLPAHSRKRTVKRSTNTGTEEGK